jgi:hypothetical protein
MNTRAKVAIAAIILAALPLTGCSNSPEIVEGETTNAQTPLHGPIEGQEPGDENPGSNSTDVAKFGQTVRFDNGVQLRFTKITSRPEGVVFTTKLTNTGQDPYDTVDFDLNVSYGKDGKSAECCMTGTDDYLEGSILPGRSKSATFGFVVPKSGRSDVLVEATVSWEESPAIFQGAVK